MTVQLGIAGGTAVISQATVDDLLASMHRDDTILHTRVGYRAGLAVDLQTGVPRLLEPPQPAPDGRMRFRARSRVHYHDHPIAGPARVGRNAVADVTINGLVESETTGDGRAVMVVDWSPTAAGDIQVHADPAIATDVRDSILELVQQHGGGLFEQPPGVSGLTHGAVALAAAAQGADLEPEGGIAILIPAKHLGRDLRRALRRELGGTLPPPYGAHPVSVGEEVVPRPTFETPEPALERTLVERLEVTLRDGAADVDLAIAGRGRRSRCLSVCPGARAEHEGTDEVERGIARAVDRVLDGGAPSERRVLGGLRAVLGLAGDPAFEVIRREVRPEGLVLHIDVTALANRPPPVAEFAVLPGASARERVFHAGPSWAPAGDIHRFRWDFGDGTSEQSEGTGARFVTSHTYPSGGTFQATLTVTDDLGRTAAQTQHIGAGQLTLLERVHDGAVELAVLDGEAPVADARVEMTVGDERRTVLTDEQGRARLPLDGRAKARLAASKPGYPDAVVERS